MSAIAAGTLLLLFLPFLLSLAGRGSMAKMICLLTGVLSVLLGVEPGQAMLPWAVGMTIALVSVWERIRERHPV